MPELVYFADLTHTGAIINNSTFPLGIGFIASYAKKVFGEEIECELFKFPQELNDALLHRRPDVLCFSYFQWNARLVMEFVKYHKERHPEVPIILGGPNISLLPEGRQEMLERHPLIDFYVKWEGEKAFAALNRALVENGYDSEAIRQKRLLLDNVLYMADGEYVEGPDMRSTELMEIPSPYTTGILDKFFDQGLQPLIEIARGCPYACTFCCDAPSQRNKVYRRTVEDTREELEYIASRVKFAGDLFVADLNFGQYKDDLETARIIRSMIDKYDWPKRISCSPGKSQPDRVLETVKIINGDRDGIVKFGSSLQSTDQLVLDSIKRKNLPMEKVLPVLNARDLSEKDNTEYFTEFILALPEDTKEKHFQSLRDAIDYLGMDVMNVHQLTMLEGSPMALQQQRDYYEFDTRQRVYVGALGMYQIGESEVPVAEFEEIVVANKTMPYEDWIECRVVSLLVKIYIDRENFLEVFGLVRRLGLSRFDLVLHLREHFIDRYPKFSRLIDLYVRKTKEPLHESLEDLERLMSRKENIEKFESGELGGNELVVHRAKAYLDCSDELHEALRDATLSYLTEHDALDDEMADYVEQAVRFSQMRKVDVTDYESEAQAQFSFDLLDAQRKHFRVLPGEVRAEPSTIRFFLGETARKELEYAMETHFGRGSVATLGKRNGGQGHDLEGVARNRAQFEYNMGKLFHLSNLKVIQRTAELAS